MYLTLKHPTRKCALDRHLVPSDICSVDQVCLKKRKKNEGEQNQATLTEQVWSIRDGKKGQKRNFSCVTNARNPEREKWIHLSHSSRRSERHIRFIFSHIINFVTTCKTFINRRLEEGQVSKKLAD